MKATIFEIKRFAVHDGDGIRTTVFFKGCPLNCIWCHNPEGISKKPQLAYIEHKCISCGACVNVCQTNAHTITNGVHNFNRSLCIQCGKCEDSCFAEALKLYGRIEEVDTLLPLLLEDKDFYTSSGGGVTLSGGECLCQADFCAELLKKLKQNNVHTAVDTCGFVPRSAFEKVMPYTDIFLFDIKAFDEDVHINCTGQSNKLILENLKFLDENGKQIEIRIPYVPEYNSSQMKKISAFIAELSNVTKVRILPYHNYAGSKYDSLGIKNTLPKILPATEETMEICEYMKTLGINAVV